MDKLKNLLYFPVAWYFRFFAGIKLSRWKPRVVVVTGSSGKTTLLHLLEAQMGDRAVFSHHANSAYGIPFFILGLQRESFKSVEWIRFFLFAPVNAFMKTPKEKIFVVEADTDRWGEGRFLAEFLRPEVVLWTSVGRTHGMNFERQIGNTPPGNPVGYPGGDTVFKTVDEAIAYDFGYFLEYCSKLSVINGDLDLEVKQKARTNSKVVEIKRKEYLDSFEVSKDNTLFQIKGEKFSFHALLPEEIFYSIAICQEVCGYFGIPFDKKFSGLELPPGRSSIFRGVKDTTIIDSSYNANLSSMRAVLNMFDKMPGESKWVVLGDMLELGEKEREEHERLGEILADMDLVKIILVGERVGEYTFPIVDQRSKIKDPADAKAMAGKQNQNSHLRQGYGGQAKINTNNHISRLENGKWADGKLKKFMHRGEVLEYLNKNLGGGEMILFKGSASMYLEDIIEKLLENKKDAEFLPRRGEFWEKRRSGN